MVTLRQLQKEIAAERVKQVQKLNRIPGCQAEVLKDYLNYLLNHLDSETDAALYLKLTDQYLQENRERLGL